MAISRNLFGSDSSKFEFDPSHDPLRYDFLLIKKKNKIKKSDSKFHDAAIGRSVLMMQYCIVYRQASWADVHVVVLLHHIW